MEILNYLRKRKTGVTFIAGGKYRKYEGWDYGKIAFYAVVLSWLAFTVYSIVK